MMFSFFSLLFSACSTPPCECPATDSGISASDTTAMPDTAVDVDSALPSDSGESDEEQSRIASVYLLGGQSNMAGFSQRSGLPPSLRSVQDDVQLYWSGLPGWRGLSPSSPHSSGYGHFTGPEASFGRLVANYYPEKNIHLIKHAVSGTDLYAFWNPGASPDDTSNMGEGYRVFQQTVFDGLAALEAQGFEVRVEGMIWMQGESDASYSPYAAAYQENLQNLIARVREDVATPDMEFIIGKIACTTEMCPDRNIVRLAQDAVAQEDPLVQTIETEDLERNFDDPWHYTGQSMRVIGMRFAEALLGLPQSPLPTPAVQLTGEWRNDYYGNYTVGWSFQLHEPVIVTDIGQIDIELDGLNHDTHLAFWREDTYELIFEGNIPKAASDSTSLLGYFRSTAIDPFLLTPGNYIVGLQSFVDNPDWYVYEAVYTASAEVSHTGYRHSEGSVLAFPWYAGATGETGAWFGPNFWYISP
ncbi:MAG: sialate O-acetylesterase [Myxococcota bacterium]|nr:sialate O-acetylesterase [Myxococcota bacterium]